MDEPCIRTGRKRIDFGISAGTRVLRRWIKTDKTEEAEEMGESGWTLGDCFEWFDY